MKFALALTFVSLSVLTSAKLDFGHKDPHGYGDPYDHGCGNGTTNPGNVTLPGNTTLPIPSGTPLPGNGTVPGNTTLPANTTDPGVPPADATNPPTKREVLARGGRRVKDPSHHDCGNGTTNPGNVTLPGNTTLPIPSSTALPGNGTTPGNTTLPANTTDPGTPPTYPTDPATKREVSARAGGWVQKPSGGASFTAYGGCQSACKRTHQLSSWLLHAERDVLLQRVAKG